MGGLNSVIAERVCCDYVCEWGNWRAHLLCLCLYVLVRRSGCDGWFRTRCPIIHPLLAQQVRLLSFLFAPHVLLLSLSPFCPHAACGGLRLLGLLLPYGSDVCFNTYQLVPLLCLV